MDSYACPRWIFIFDSDQAQINSVVTPSVAAQYPARANSTGIRLLSSVPHLWSSSFDCPVSPERRRPSAAGLLLRTHSAGLVSQICIT